MSLEIGEILFIFCITCTLVFSIAGNIIVITIVVKTPKLRNVTNLLICNLSVCDIVLAGIVLPQNLHDLSHTEDYFEGDFLCRVVNFAPIMCITSSIYTLVAIGFERRRALMLQVEPTNWVPVILKTLPTIWVITSIMCIPTIIEYKSYTFLEGNKTRVACGRLEADFPLKYSIMNGFMLLIMSYIIPLILLLYNYFKIFMYFWKDRKEKISQFQAADNSRNMAKKKHRLQILKMLVLVASFFALSWLPYFVLLIIAKMSGKDDSEAYSGPINMLRISLATFSCAYNVVLYSIYNRNFRDAFLVTFKCCRRITVSPSNNTTPPVKKSLENQIVAERTQSSALKENSVGISQQ